MAEIVTPFVELLYIAELNSKSKNSEFFEKALYVKNNFQKIHGWQCNTYSSIETEYDVKEDPLFSNLINECGVHVNEFAKQYGAQNKKLLLVGSWINVAETNNYQEYHMHSKSHFSLCYYVNTPDNCGEIVFKSHDADKDMFPLPKSDNLTLPNYKSFSVEPKAGNIILFKSNLLHMVKANLSKEPRVSISMNFILEG
jgi:uncharacterized protein (TIGR02466 family)